MALTLEDRLALQELMHRYAYALDVQCTEQELLSLFTEDAVMDGNLTGRFEGVDGLRKWASRLPDRRGKVQLRHFISNFIIDGEADRATIKAYFFQTFTQLEVVFPKAERSTELIFAGNYDCVARKVDGQWKLQHRTCNVDSRASGVAPMALPVAAANPASPPARG